MGSRLLLYVLIVCSVAIPVLAESAKSEYKAGERAEKKNDLDTAFQAYKMAHEANPSDPKYMAAYLRLRTSDSAHHIQAGELLRDSGKMQEALAEFRMAAQIDPSNFEALGQVRRTVDLIQRDVREKEAATTLKSQNSSLEKDAASAAGPAVLDFKSDTPVSIHLTTTTDVIYKTIGKLGGFNVLIDPEYKPQKITFEVNNVSLRDALSMVAIQSKTFFRPLSSNTIMVSADTSSKRKELDQNVMKTFYLRNASTPAELQEAASTLKSVLDISHIQATPEVRSLTLRGTPGQMILAQKLLTDIDKPKGEVLIEVVVMETSRDRLHTFGVVPPTTITASIAPGGASSSGSSSSGSSGGLTLESLTNLSAGDISITIPSASFTALASDSGTKVIQRPEIRVVDSEKASLKIGDRIPIATGSFQNGVGGGVNTQFQYLDVGVNIDITPYIHAGNDVTLKMSLEVSSVTGETSVGGITEPTIGQRRIDHEARLADGEVNLIGGLLQDTETKSMSGYPWLTKLPILKYLFGQETKERQQSEIVFAIIPHITRSTEITDQNMKMVDLGSANSVTYRKEATQSEPAVTSSLPTHQPPVEKPSPVSPTASPIRQ